MKFAWALWGVAIVLIALTLQVKAQEFTPVELVESESASSSSSSSTSSSTDAGIIYDGGFIELDQPAAGTGEREDALNQEDQDAALLEVESENETEGDAESEAEAESDSESESESEGESEAEGETEHEDSSLLERTRKPRVTVSLPRPASAPTGIVQTGRGRPGRSCRGPHCGKRRQHGWGIAPAARRRVQQRLPEPRLTGAAATLTRANVRCVLCQFITQKLKGELTGENAEGSASLLEAFAFASAGAQSRIEATVKAAAYADASASAVPALFDHGADAPRRFRHTDVLAARASRARFTQVRSGADQSAKAQEQREAYLQLYSKVYATFEDLCAKKMPLAYLPYCNDMLKSYRFFAQGINYGDRPEQICMNGNYCDHRAYVRRVTHNSYQREPGDA